MLIPQSFQSPNLVILFFVSQASCRLPDILQHMTVRRPLPSAVLTGHEYFSLHMLYSYEELTLKNHLIRGQTP